MQDYGKFKGVKAALITDITFFFLTLTLLLIANIFTRLSIFSVLFFTLIFFTGLYLPIGLKKTHFVWNTTNVIGIATIPFVVLLSKDEVFIGMYIFILCTTIASLLLAIVYIFVKRKLKSAEMLKIANVVIILFGTIRYRVVYLLYYIAIQIICYLIVSIVNRGLYYVRRPSNVDRVK